MLSRLMYSLGAKSITMKIQYEKLATFPTDSLFTVTILYYEETQIYMEDA